MRVKICGIKNERELEIAVNAGVDAAGFLVGQRHPSPDFILPEQAARLASLLPPFVTPVLVTHLTEPGEIMELIDRTLITTLQLHGGSSPEQIPPLREYLEGAGKVILTVHVGAGPSNISTPAAPYEALVDAFLLDSYDPVSGKVGGTGKTHDWQISAGFVRTTAHPVILAGGLNPDNVAFAIRTVRPYAVDANSCLRPLGTLDPGIAASFVRNARNAGEDQDADLQTSSL